MSGPILEDEGIAAAKNDQTRPAWSLAAREESQTTNKETEMDKVNPDNDKCYEENRTSRVTGWPWCGEGGQWSCAASEKTFLRGLFQQSRKGEDPCHSVQIWPVFTGHPVPCGCAPFPVILELGCGPQLWTLGSTSFLPLPVPQILSLFSTALPLS